MILMSANRRYTNMPVKSRQDVCYSWCLDINYWTSDVIPIAHNSAGKFVYEKTRSCCL